MIRTLIIKEMRSYFTSPKFVAVFATCAFLILLSVFIGIQEYKAAVSNYNTGTQLAAQDLQERNSWMGAGTRVFRAPDPMQIFVSGISNDIGRLSSINDWEQVKLRNSTYSDDPIFATFRYLDFSFIVQIVLSLLAIMFTFDAVTGERESGTLKLIFANSVPRTRFLLAKLAGSWLGLSIPLLMPLLLSILLLLSYNIPLTPDHWVRICILFGLSIVYYTFFIICGVTVSSLTRTSSVAFLALMVVWVFLVLIIPRVGVLTAANFVRVPGIAEVDARIEGYTVERWKEHEKIMLEAWRSRNAAMSGMSKEERKAYEDDHMWGWMEEDEANRRSIQAEISAYARKMKEEILNQREYQQHLAFGISRLSPSSAFRLASMQLAGTGMELKKRYEMAMENYKDLLNNFIKNKRGEGNDPGGIRITFDTENGFSFQTSDLKKTIDITEMPLFDQPETNLAEILPRSVLDFMLIIASCLLVFSIAWTAFLRYDVR